MISEEELQSAGRGRSFAGECRNDADNTLPSTAKNFPNLQIYFFFQFCNQFFYDWIKFFTCFCWYCMKCLVVSKKLFFNSKSCVPTELFSASGKYFSKNSELKLFMRFWKLSSETITYKEGKNIAEIYFLTLQL